MKKINYPLIISDFDGTLANDNHEVSTQVRTAVTEYVESGGIFAVITGRMLSSALPQVRSLGLKGLVAAYQGTVIADIESGEIIKRGGFDYKEAAEIVRVMGEFGGKCNLYCNETLYTERKQDDELLKLYTDITKVKAYTLEQSAADYINEYKPYCQKIVALVMPDERDNLYNALNERLGNKYDVTYSSVVLVEVSPKGDNKGVALKYIADRYGIPYNRTVAVGDNLNDLSMIQAAGVGVAVGNATEILKRAADRVTVSNNDDAVAVVISEYGFEKD